MPIVSESLVGRGFSRDISAAKLGASAPEVTPQEAQFSQHAGWTQVLGSGFGVGAPSFPLFSGRMGLSAPHLVLLPGSVPPAHTGSILTNPSSLPSYHEHELHTQSRGAATNPRFTGFICIYSSFSIFFLSLRTLKSKNLRCQNCGNESSPPN